MLFVIGYLVILISGWFFEAFQIFSNVGFCWGLLLITGFTSLPQLTGPWLCFFLWVISFHVVHRVHRVHLVPLVHLVHLVLNCDFYERPQLLVALLGAEGEGRGHQQVEYNPGQFLFLFWNVEKEEKYHKIMAVSTPFCWPLFSRSGGGLKSGWVFWWFSFRIAFPVASFRVATRVASCFPTFPPSGNV